MCRGPQRGVTMKLYLVLDCSVAEAGELGTHQHWPICHTAKLWEETGVVKMSSTFCASQLNQYLPCVPCLWIMITGHRVASEKFPTSCPETGRIANRPQDLHPLEQRPNLRRHRKVAHVFLIPV